MLLTSPPVPGLAPGFVPTRPAPATSVQAGWGLIATDLARAEAVFADALARYDTPIGTLVDHLKHYRGKRLRPALVFFAARACGKVSDAHPTLAAAVEMIHTATLVHDDVLDEAETRRHVRTVNAEWGNKASILFGDLLFTHAFHLTSSVDARACRLIGEATNRVCAGELRQVSERGNLHLTEATYFAILDGKTAALTEVSCRLGALYAGATEPVAAALAHYGQCLGMAFQVADDLLDFVGHEGRVGKTLGTDLAQQKLTLPVIDALETLPPRDAERLREMLRHPSAENAVRVRSVLESAGSFERSRRRAEGFVREALEALQVVPPSEARSMLEAMAGWALGRDQ